MRLNSTKDPECIHLLFRLAEWYKAFLKVGKDSFLPEHWRNVSLSHIYCLPNLLTYYFVLKHGVKY